MPSSSWGQKSLKTVGRARQWCKSLVNLLHAMVCTFEEADFMRGMPGSRRRFYVYKFFKTNFATISMTSNHWPKMACFQIILKLVICRWIEVLVLKGSGSHPVPDLCQERTMGGNMILSSMRAIYTSIEPEVVFWGALHCCVLLALATLWAIRTQKQGRLFQKIYEQKNVHAKGSFSLLPHVRKTALSWAWT